MRQHALRSLSFSYQKKDWQAWPHQSFFGYDTDYRIIYVGSRVIFYSRCHTQRRIGGAPVARQTVFGYDNGKDLKVCFLVTRAKCPHILFKLLCINKCHFSVHVKQYDTPVILAFNLDDSVDIH